MELENNVKFDIDKVKKGLYWEFLEYLNLAFLGRLYKNSKYK